MAYTITDNGNNMVAALEILGWNGLSCFGNKLHLAITNSMKDDRIIHVIGIAHKLVGAFAHSWKKKRDLIKVQTEMDVPQHSLVTECTTRWELAIRCCIEYWNKKELYYKSWQLILKQYI